ncbi:S-layer homology domain-containing protein [Cohnella cellulosilytica]|uniref:S-layer homology domain-containing protein n=1 Tax=Cohnella cellulosilytica TaxID=986710 RepID=A0ABW2F854_9BACL
MNLKFRKSMLLLALVAVFSLTISGSAFAGTDKASDKKEITIASAVSAIVKGLGLNIDHIRFIKEPQASDYYTKVADNAAYANDFIIAQFNGLDLPRDVNPAAKVTREQFAKWLYGALSSKGDYAWIEIFLNVSDADLVTDGYMDSIQKMLIAKIFTLDSKQRFHPQNGVTQAQAGLVIARTNKFIEDVAPISEPEPSVLSNVLLSSEKITDEVLKVTLTATVPHPGYGIEITGISFVKNEAVIQYRAVLPDPDKMYPQVLGEVSISTYVSSEFSPVLGDEQPAVPFQG